MTYANAIEALAEPRRREIVEQLRARPLSVAELAATQPVSRPAISPHLRALADAGLVWAEQQGPRRIYHLRREGLEELRLWLDGFWGDALDAFAAEVSRRQGYDK